MKLRIQLVAAAFVACSAVQTRADPVYCTAVVSADRTNVCVGDTVNISIDSTTCTNGYTVYYGTNYSTSYGTAGVYTISASCSACSNWDWGTVGGSGSVKIYVSQITGVSPNYVTMCPGSYRLFTVKSNPTNIPCGPSWSISPADAGTISANGTNAIFTLSSAHTSGTATLSASCGTTTNTAKIFVLTSGLTITTQPVSRVACPGSNVTFSVAATGSSLSYQWLWNGLILTNGGHISGATNSTLTISNVYSTTSTSNVVLAHNDQRYSFGYLHGGDLYTYQATGCATVHDLYNADPDGNTYTNGDCSAFFGGPTPAGDNCECPGLAKYSLVIGYPYCAQLGSSSQFQQARSGITSPMLFLNDNSRFGDSGSWEVTLNHTVEGVYSCIVSSSCGSMISTGATLYVSTPCDGIPDSWRMEYFGRTDTNIQTCATCYYVSGSALDNRQDYDCGFDPRVAVQITTPMSVYSGMTGNVASVTAVGPGVSYSWTVSNGTVTAGSNSTTVTWTAGNPGTATLSVTLTGAQSCNTTIYTNIVVTRAYYVDYVGGSDTNGGINTGNAWQHCPGDPQALRNPATNNLVAGDTVFFKGGVSYVLQNSGSVNSSLPWSGIVLKTGGVSNPVVYDGNLAGLWGTGRAVITDNGGNGGTNSFAAFGMPPPNFYAAFSNIVIQGFQIGPIGGTTNAFPLPYVETNFAPSITSYTTGGTLSITYDEYPLEVGQGVGATGSGMTVTNTSASPVTITNVTFIGNFWTWPYGNFTFLGNTNVSVFFNSLATNVYGQFTGAALLQCNNGQILTNILQTRVVPQCFAWGIAIGGPVTNVTIANNLFTQIGYWQNQYPIGNSSGNGKGIWSWNSAGTVLISGLKIVSNEFTKVNHATELGMGSVTNVVIANNNFHDYICWGVAPSFANSLVADGIQIYSNNLHDMGWAYYQAYGNYYGVTNTEYHQDPIIFDVSAPCNFGSNNNIYANTFSDSHTTNSSAASGQIFLSGGASANIYNNLFNIQTGDSGGGSFITINDGVQNGSTLSCNMFNPTLVRILNNTFISDLNNPVLLAGGGDAYNGITAYWPTNHIIWMLNNIAYQFDTNRNDAGSLHMATLGTIGNTNVFSSWWWDYNNWYVSTNMNSWFTVTDANGAHSGTFSLMQQYGFDADGTTNNPHFIDISHGDMQNAYLNNYNLSNSSPCMAAGTNLTSIGLPGLNTDSNGNLRPPSGAWAQGAYQ